MSILLSGDFHIDARGELAFLTKEYLVKQYGWKQFNEISYHIILGDGGFLWPGQEERETVILETLAERPFPILCVFGNHEPVLGRPDLPEIDIGIGEKVIVVSEKNPQLFFLKRGKIYNIENRKFLVLGGALSIDKRFRRPNTSWWENEYWTEEEEAALFALLEKDNNFDYVLSHTGPDRINWKGFAKNGADSPEKYQDKVAKLNDEIDSRINCKQWFCGHWHQAYHYYDVKMQRGYQYLYYESALMKDTEIIAPMDTV